MVVVLDERTFVGENEKKEGDVNANDHSVLRKIFLALSIVPILILP